MPKVYISPSVQTYNLCEYGDTEKDHCQLYADILQRYFDACGIEYRRNYNQTFQQAVAESNSWGPDIHYACHTNAFNGQTRYSVLLVYNAVADNSAFECANDIREFRTSIYPNPIYVNQNRSLYEIRYSTSPCVYDEIVFHDNVDDATLFHVRMQSFAETTTRGFCRYFGIPFVYPEGVDLEPGVSDTPTAVQTAASVGADTDSSADVPLGQASTPDFNQLMRMYSKCRNDMLAMQHRHEQMVSDIQSILNQQK